MLINPIDPAGLDRLLAELAADARETNCYLLLDCALKPALLKQIRRSGLNWLSLFTESNAGEEELLAVSPCLLQWYPSSQSGVLRQLLKHCDGLPMASIWLSAEDLAGLCQRLAAWCVVKADGQYFNLRFPDTRRLPDIAQVLTPEQKNAFFAAVTDCFYLGRNGAWHRLDVGETPLVPAAIDPELDQSQTLTLINSAEADELLQLIRSQRVMPAQLPLQLYQCVCDALKQADVEMQCNPLDRQQRCQQALDALPVVAMAKQTNQPAAGLNPIVKKVYV